MSIVIYLLSVMVNAAWLTISYLTGNLLGVAVSSGTLVALLMIALFVPYIHVLEDITEEVIETATEALEAQQKGSK